MSVVSSLDYLYFHKFSLFLSSMNPPEQLQPQNLATTNATMELQIVSHF